MSDRRATSGTRANLDHAEAKARIRNAVRQAWDRSLCHYQLAPRSLPEIDFSLRGRVAAQAGWRIRSQGLRKTAGDFRLRFNLQAYNINPDEMLKDTVPHEIAHLIVVMLWGPGCRPHGAEWRQVMQECFNLAAQRTHNLPLAPSRTLKRTFAYACKCREHRLTSIRHRRMEGGQSIYRCRDCGEILTIKR